MCEMLNTEPKLEEIPVEREDLFIETQEVLFYFDKLPAQWEGFSGQYMGKDLSLLPILFKEFKVDKYIRRYCWEIIPIIDNFIAEDVADKIKARSKQGAKSGGKSGNS